MERENRGGYRQWEKKKIRGTCEKYHPDIFKAGCDLLHLASVFVLVLRLKVRDLWSRVVRVFTQCNKKLF